MSDSDTISELTAPTSFHSMFSDAISGVQFKLFGMMFLTFVFLQSSLFVNRVLFHIDGATIGAYPSSFGVIIQGICLVIACLVFDISIHSGIL